jgi:2,3-dihydroxybiphenyl 1,2-dioxygenase
MKHELELAYLGLEIADPTALDGFLGAVIGMVPGESSGTSTSSWRNDDRVHRVIVQPGDSNDAKFVGFEAVNNSAFERITEQLAAAGFDVNHGGAEHTRARRVERLAFVEAPWGMTVEIVQGLEGASTAYASPLMPGGFLTESVGFGHVVFATTEYDETHRFLVDGLGLRQSDWLEMEIAEGLELEVHFYHCNERHHSIAVARAPFELPQVLHHFMLETNRRDDVGAAFDRAWTTNLAIPNGLGRHDNDWMFSFYVKSPAGFLVEVGYGARLITDDWDDDRCYDRISAWGHQPLRQG